MNHSLLRPFTPEEVIAAFHNIGTRKAPGIDGFPSSFFRLHWEIIVGTGPYRGAAVKLDIEKAFDRVEWNFVRDVMLRLGFDAGWVDLILRWISTVSFSVRINALSALLNVDCSQGGLIGLCASKNGPRISHLLFADDNLMFLRNYEDDALRLKHILHVYEMASGQRVPLSIGQNKTNSLGYVRDAVNDCIASWNKHLLSFGGREVFITSVIQALPQLAQHSANCPDVLHAEFSAIVVGLYLARDSGWRKIQIESDSAILINKFNRTGPYLSVLSSQISNARELLCHLDDCIFSFAPKCCNSAKHTLATYVCKRGTSLFFDSSCPAVLDPIVLADLN
ncbi:hypothetical protein GQ457_06G012530 [Hibiscus cannabinus]